MTDLFVASVLLSCGAGDGQCGPGVSRRNHFGSHCTRRCDKNIVSMSTGREPISVVMPPISYLFLVDDWQRVVWTFCRLSVARRPQIKDGCGLWCPDEA